MLLILLACIFAAANALEIKSPYSGQGAPTYSPLMIQYSPEAGEKFISTAVIFANTTTCIETNVKANNFCTVIPTSIIPQYQTIIVIGITTDGQSRQSSVAVQVISFSAEAPGSYGNSMMGSLSAITAENLWAPANLSFDPYFSNIFTNQIPLNIVDRRVPYEGKKGCKCKRQ